MTYRGPIVDVDVHHRPKRDADVIEYLPKRWREYVLGDPRRPFPLDPPASAGASLLGTKMVDSFPADGSPSASSYELLRDQLLNKHNYYRAVLAHDNGDYPGHLNPYFSQALCSAINEWNMEQWLPLDDRLYSVIVAPFSVPDLAAAEIRRVGAHPKFLGVLLTGNMLGRPLGDPLYDPIYEAATEMGLMIAVHPGAVDRPTSQTRAVGGARANPLENVTQIAQSAMHYVTSLIVHGVFEKFPSLKFLIKEQGITWIPFLTWRLDEYVELLRFESPFVKRWPSEIIHEHVKFSTQPLEESPDDKGAMAELLDTVDGMENLLCFSTDYPHVSYDDPLYAARVLPAKWHRKVFCENACATYGWKAPDADWSAGHVAAASR